MFRIAHGGILTGFEGRQQIFVPDRRLPSQLVASVTRECVPLNSGLAPLACIDRIRRLNQEKF
ncbi:MAG: hypothetical protein OEU86_04860 [Gammaproteobacteria bacterium]|nr:hypothetical protein [Gammaproteobacteria bacterium]